MRKIFSLSLLWLIFTSVSTSILAGYPACDDNGMKEFLQNAGVYGWCNAWHDNPDERAEIEAKIFGKTDWTVLPWEEEQSIEFDCVCWDELDEFDICPLGVPTVWLYDKVQDPDIYNGILQFGSGATAQWFAVTPFSECIHHTGSYPPDGGLYTSISPGEAEICGYDLGVIYALTVGALCDN